MNGRGGLGVRFEVKCHQLVTNYPGRAWRSLCGKMSPMGDKLPGKMTAIAANVSLGTIVPVPAGFPGLALPGLLRLLFGANWRHFAGVGIWAHGPRFVPHG